MSTSLTGPDSYQHFGALLLAGAERFLHFDGLVLVSVRQNAELLGMDGVGRRRLGGSTQKDCHEGKEKDSFVHKRIVWKVGVGAAFSRKSADEVGKVLIAPCGLELEAFVTEGLQFVGVSRSVLQDEAHHGSAAGLGPDGLHLQPALPVAHVEERLDDPHLASHALPIEEVLVFFRAEMDEDAVVGLDAVNQEVGQPIFPELVDGAVVRSLKAHAVLHAVGHNGVHRAEQAVEKTGNPEMLLGELQVVAAERLRPQMFIGLSVVGQDSRHLRGNRKFLVALQVNGGQLTVAVELPAQFVGVEAGHFGC